MIFTLTTSRFVHIFHGVTKSIIANWIVSQFMEQKKEKCYRQAGFLSRGQISTGVVLHTL